MAGEKVLVIDDEKIIHTAFKRELEPEGYKVDSALSGEEAIEKVKTKNYKLIFVDSILPGMDGIQTCEAIKKIRPDSILIFMTGTIYAGLTWKEVDFIKAGGRIYYLYKPFREGEILEVAKKALAERG